ncbi:FAD-dependent monooxygenase [Mammaliicoccus vitulinus]|uniref:FAD-dependent monooxygenase n=2 Tax=Mammaliicoccus vitulinus TaxID=71237 RepID=A0ABX7HBF0_9STAP|nr:FAD-dependent monooxygenase [Mammaliicoccus vitulinus]HAL09500.1 FAD-binding protein [Staphylococcus sp.]MEB7657271.1 FAD-dependent monooxygenase [Mammaliicoccus vitulinus]PNZ39746.1 FAD-binding protein [Mammaliicoccus vitulinus]PTI38305.1 FAD-binding protein [Mammaliicoccus vitulinus]PTI71790.1 FAD-binding protein [Mammaliicoccus vitulinus]
MKIAVIGAGIGGLTAAGLLCQTGHDVYVYEKRNNLDQVGAGVGIGSNVLKALKQYKMAYAIEQEGQSLRKIEIKSDLDEFLNALMMNQDDNLNVTIHRNVLHEILKTHVPKERILLNHKLTEFKQTPDSVRLYFENGVEEQFDLVIAADGIHSVVRTNIYPKSTPKYAGYTCFRGVVNEKLNLEQDEALEYWGHKGRFGIVPLKDNELYWFCTMNAKENDLQFKSFEKPHLQAYFNQFPNEVRKVLDAQEETGILQHDMYDLVPLKSFVSGRVVLLGDAAHATTPNMGQGAGQAIEDAVTLTNLISDRDIESALTRYDKIRTKHTKKVILKSRKIGKSAQTSSTLKIKIRNKMLKKLSSKSLSRKVRFLQKAKLK